MLWVPEHLNYLTEAGLRALFVSTGFSILEVRHVARIPYYALSRRLGLSGTPRSVLNTIFQVIQWLPMRVLERLGSGLTIQVWATIKTES